LNKIASPACKHQRKQQKEDEGVVPDVSCRLEVNTIINPGKYSLDLSALSSLSSMSTVTNSISGMPAMEASLSLPSISMELESLNEKLVKIFKFLNLVWY